MALSLSNFLYAIVMLLPYGQVASAAIVNLDWNVSWVAANPDGMFTRPTIGINGQWPLPLYNFTKGDNIIVNLNNQVWNMSLDRQ